LAFQINVAAKILIGHFGTFCRYSSNWPVKLNVGHPFGITVRHMAVNITIL